MKKAELRLIKTGYKMAAVKRLDVDGKWPKGTWMQQRLAMLKLTEARKVLNNGRE